MTNIEKLRECFPNTIFIYRKEDDRTTALMCSDEWLESEYKAPDGEDAYNKGYADGMKAQAEHESLCKEEREISKEKAIEILRADSIASYSVEDILSARDMAIKALEQEPRKGHWIPTYGNVKCSVCGNVKDSREVGRATHYCDFCGAKMEVEE